MKNLQMAEAGPVIQVERAVRDLRAGLPVVVRTEASGGVAVWSAETAMRGDWPVGDELALILTGVRVRHLSARGEQALRVPLPQGIAPEMIMALADPGVSIPAEQVAQWLAQASPASREDQAALQLMKYTSLLPAALVSSQQAVQAQDVLQVTIEAIDQYPEAAAGALVIAAQARVPLAQAEDARVVAFLPQDGTTEHLAILIGSPEKDPAPLVRVHSSCLTGDLLGSLRCDCGAQLQAALRHIGDVGSGVILYLNQEGRGIGIVNKLRAYALQEKGIDTLDANEQLGFDADERHFRPAAEMLRVLEIRAVRMLTNNPEKVRAMEHHGIVVRERQSLAIPAGEHNRDYLETKVRRCGHIFSS